MSEPTLDILGIGNAIVDVLARADDDFLDARGLAKGGMRLIGAEEAEALYGQMGPGLESSGGSAGNTMAGIASLGGSGAYIGKVRNDELGDVFRHDMTAIGVRFTTAPATIGPPTARCLILVTPDAQRTMNTFLGACVDFSAADVDAEEVARAKVVYLEGYLFDPPAAQAAFFAASHAAHEAGRQVALTLSDPFCVERHRQAFRRFLREETDILFANESEILSLYQTDDFETAATLVRQDVGLAALTRSAQGSVIIAGEERHEVEAVPTEVVDTTGAGDAYAAGFLAALTRGLPLPECGRWGAIAAAEVISHFGARPQANLKALVAAPPGNHTVSDVLG